MRSIVASEFADLFSKFKKLTEFAESASSAINNHVQTIAIAVDRGIKQAAWIEVASEDSWLFRLLNQSICRIIFINLARFLRSSKIPDEFIIFFGK